MLPIVRAREKVKMKIFFFCTKKMKKIWVVHKY